MKNEKGKITGLFIKAFKRVLFKSFDGMGF